jgi:predicted CXXCH cytochrome family protein
LVAAPIDRLQFGYNGPTEEYSLFPMPTRNALSATAGTLELLDAATGLHRFTYAAPAIDVSAFGSVDFGVEGRIVDLAGNRFATPNEVFTVAVNDATPDPRRHPVAQESCNACHFDLKLHGNNRLSVEYCATCHNPQATDVSRRPAGAGDPETVNFSVMIHKIHRGSHLSGDYTVYGFGGTAHDFTNVHFPGNLADCSTCHKTGSGTTPYHLEPSGEMCASCHDSDATQAHIQVNTAPGGLESCSVCHAAGKELGVDKVHAKFVQP